MPHDRKNNNKMQCLILTPIRRPGACPTWWAASPSSQTDQAPSVACVRFFTTAFIFTNVFRHGLAKAAVKELFGHPDHIAAVALSHSPDQITGTACSVVPTLADIVFMPYREDYEVARETGIVERMAGIKAFSTYPPSVRDLPLDLSVQILHPLAAGVRSAIQTPRVNVVVVHGGVFAIHFLGHHHHPSDKVCFQFFVRQYPVIVRGARTPRQVVSSGILYVFLELTCNPAIPEYLLNRLIAKQFAFNPASVWHDDISPFVVNIVGVEVGRKNGLFDSSRRTDRSARKGSLFSENMAVGTEAGAVVELVSAIVKQPPFHDVMSVTCRRVADYAEVGISLEYGVPLKAQPGGLGACPTVKHEFGGDSVQVAEGAPVAGIAPLAVAVHRPDAPAAGLGSHEVEGCFGGGGFVRGAWDSLGFGVPGIAIHVVPLE